VSTIIIIVEYCGVTIIMEVFRIMGREYNSANFRIMGRVYNNGSFRIMGRDYFNASF